MVLLLLMSYLYKNLTKCLHMDRTVYGCNRGKIRDQFLASGCTIANMGNVNERGFMEIFLLSYRVFSRDVTAAMLVSLNNGTAAILVYPTNPPGIELYYHANVFFGFGGKTSILITRVRTLYSS